MPSITLGDTVFNTKKDATEYFRRMLWGAEIGARIPEPAATDLFYLLRRHPHFTFKQGVGIAHFSVRETIHGARAFEVVRQNATRTEFSLYACLEPPPRNAG